MNLFEDNLFEAKDKSLDKYVEEVFTKLEKDQNEAISKELNEYKDIFSGIEAIVDKQKRDTEVSMEETMTILSKVDSLIAFLINDDENKHKESLKRLKTVSSKLNEDVCNAFSNTVDLYRDSGPKVRESVISEDEYRESVERMDEYEANHGRSTEGLNYFKKI